jgi:hypothetical protein
VSESRTIALLGLPRTGKSTYVGALWLLIQDPSSASVVESDAAGDRSYVDELADMVGRAQEMPRTEVDSREGLAISIEFDDGPALWLSLPDLSGESVRELVEERHWRLTLEQALEDADALVLFVHPDRIGAPIPIAMAAAAAGPLVDAAPAHAPVFEPKRACTAAKLVDAMENILDATRRPEPLRVAIVVSAWDTVAGDRTPDAWLAERLPGLRDMLMANPDLVETRVFGVSAQGGRLPDQQSELASRELRFRVYAKDGAGRPADLSDPLRWAAGG